MTSTTADCKPLPIRQDARGRTRLTLEVKQQLVRQAERQPRLPGEVAYSGVTAQVECCMTKSQRAWYHRASQNALKLAKKQVRA